jgi:hypothetical protein
MTVEFQVAFDCSAPAELARLWVATLGLEPYPSGDQGPTTGRQGRREE